MLRFISIFFLIFALSANTQSTADILIEDGKTEVPIFDEFYSCLETKPTIPGIIITYLKRKQSLQIKNNVTCPLSTIYESPLKEKINIHYRFCYTKLLIDFWRSLNPQAMPMQGKRHCYPYYLTECLAQQDLNEEVIIDLLNAIDSDYEYWKDLIRSLYNSEKMEVVKNCIYQYQCETVILGVESSLPITIDWN